ncbi:copper chaperone CopZ [Streptomyces sp. 1114.5]|uniref:heavy-metal-associated domain-containing protein n=1 Tax=Streptomyces sp. 1114.5 TaxID=1938830 RepID=UPI000EABCA12|nr:cation transporter [Streptomyces sp. 1114.5]RKT19046.1 copper chaperone CopZ [Streptomyces sp. 1114.5]
MSETTATVQPATVEASSCCGSCSTGAAEAPAAPSALSSAFQVKGMTCGHCVSSVTAELKKLDGVTDVAVDLATGKVTVGSTRPLADADVAAAVDEAGYDLIGRLDG